MIEISYDKIKAVMQKKNYIFFTKTYDLNVIGIRNPNPEPDKFDDTLVVAYIDAGGNKRVFTCPITTDPGLYYLQNPMNSSGTAILKPGQYRGMWVLGKHKGYTALAQNKPCTVLRDTNKDKILNWSATKQETGMYYINLHRAVDGGILLSIGKYSAGCQVVQVPEDFYYILSLVHLQVRYVKSSVVTYTLLEEKDLG
ncbi:MAG: hypothetical protein Q8M92_00430 [Candidatus Subteraquimicrobiales bacterium]|nr:hypothetical protein [Candidatus Subteraquimicrobiales bacterium]